MDLLKFYKKITAEGGYDAVSKVKLKWRRMGEVLGFAGTENINGLAFSIKTIYYKNLVAYEHKNFHHIEPPPFSLLERYTARGTTTIGRTEENFQPPRDEGQEPNGVTEFTANIMGGGPSTPRQPNSAQQDVGSASRQARSGLRQTPAPRVPYQPDAASSSRPQRQNIPYVQTPQPILTQQQSIQANPASASFDVAHWSPTARFPLSLRSVLTPSTDYEEYRRQRKERMDEELAKLGRLKKKEPEQTVLPGTGFGGPSLWHRVIQSLKCEIPDEAQWALNHIVRMSHMHSTTLKLPSFPGLAEGLVEQLLKVTEICYDMEWEVDLSKGYSSDHPLATGFEAEESELTARLEALTARYDPNRLTPAERTRRLQPVLDAGVAMSNVIGLEYNARFLARYWPMKEYLCIAINLPSIDEYFEVKDHALTIASEVCRHLVLDNIDPLYKVLLKQLADKYVQDRGLIISTLRTVTAIALNLKIVWHPTMIPIELLQSIMTWFLVQDEEMWQVCLEFLYQYLGLDENFLQIIKHSEIYLDLKRDLPRLLKYQRKEYIEYVETAPAIPHPDPPEILSIPRDLVEKLNEFDEPERAGQWVKCCLKESPLDHVTQLAIWQAYQNTFTNDQSQSAKLILPAAAFIRCVGANISGAEAQIRSHPGGQRFIISGVLPRKVPITPDGFDYIKCQWKVDGDDGKVPCGQWFLEEQDLINHLFTDHLELVTLPPREEPADIEMPDAPAELAEGEGAPLAAEAPPADVIPQPRNLRFPMSQFHPPRIWYCHWHGCGNEDLNDQATSPGTCSINVLDNHIKAHLPNLKRLTERRQGRPWHRRGSSQFRVAQSKEKKCYATPRDETTGKPTGVAFMAASVMTILARKTRDLIDAWIANPQLEMDWGTLDANLLERSILDPGCQFMMAGWECLCNDKALNNVIDGCCCLSRVKRKKHGGVNGEFESTVGI